MIRDDLIQWLRDGDDLSAARLLSECEISLQFVDLAIDMSGNRDFEIYDAEILAPRKVIDKLSDELDSERELIESSLFDLAQTYHWHFRSITWLPAPPTVKSPVEEGLGQDLSEIDASQIHRFWEKAISRRVTDPDGAITAARSMLESVCKYILENEGVSYSRNADLPKLYHLTANLLSLTPESQEDEMLRRAMGNAQAVVGSLAAIRNLQGDAHGTGEEVNLPSPDFAELAVNLAGSISKFILQAWRQSKSRNGP